MSLEVTNPGNKPLWTQQSGRAAGEPGGTNETNPGIKSSSESRFRSPATNIWKKGQTLSQNENLPERKGAHPTMQAIQQTQIEDNTTARGMDIMHASTTRWGFLYEAQPEASSRGNGCCLHDHLQRDEFHDGHHLFP